MPEVMSREEKIRLLSKIWGFVCFGYCKKPFRSLEEVTLDHWKPQAWCRAQGWTEDQINDLDNLRLMCKPCNAKKGDLLPVDDTTIPVRVVSETQRERRANRGPRPVGCLLCESGRLLFPGETCPDCGSGPQPAVAPKTMQKTPKECDHAVFHCWMCHLGFIPRKSALDVLLTGDE